MKKEHLTERKILRGDIYYANLNPIIGSEQGGTRPVLIISNDLGNKYGPTVIVAAMSGRTRTKPRLPTHCYLNAEHGLEEPTLVLLEQIRVVDKRRLSKYVGSLDIKQMKDINQALAISLDLC